MKIQWCTSGGKKCQITTPSRLKNVYIFLSLLMHVLPFDTWVLTFPWRILLRNYYVIFWRKKRPGNWPCNWNVSKRRLSLGHTKFRSLCQVKLITFRQANATLWQNIQSTNVKRPGNLKLPGRFSLVDWIFCSIGLNVNNLTWHKLLNFVWPKGTSACIHFVVKN